MKQSAIGRRIRKARRSRGWTQFDLSRRARISESSMMRLETGRHTVAGERAIPRISRILGLEVVAR